MPTMQKTELLDTLDQTPAVHISNKVQTWLLHQRKHLASRAGGFPGFLSVVDGWLPIVDPKCIPHSSGDPWGPMGTQKIQGIENA